MRHRPKKKSIAYIRVSTDDQGQSGFGQSIQRKLIEYYARKRGYEIVGVFEDVETGKGDGFETREGFKQAANIAIQEGIPIIVRDLSRLARDVDTIRKLKKAETEIHSARDGGPLSDDVLEIRAAEAQFEAEEISRRTKRALSHKVGSGKLGNTKNLDEARVLANKARAQNAEAFARDLMSTIRAIKAELPSKRRQSLTDIANALNDRGVKTARGKKWRPQTVKNLLQRMEPHILGPDFGSWR